MFIESFICTLFSRQELSEWGRQCGGGGRTEVGKPHGQPCEPRLGRSSCPSLQSR